MKLLLSIMATGLMVTAGAAVKPEPKQVVPAETVAATHPAADELALIGDVQAEENAWRTTFAPMSTYVAPKPPI